MGDSTRNYDKIYNLDCPNSIWLGMARYVFLVVVLCLKITIFLLDTIKLGEKDKVLLSKGFDMGSCETEKTTLYNCSG